jgi:hypothetical protein
MKYTYRLEATVEKRTEEGKRRIEGRNRREERVEVMD